MQQNLDFLPCMTVSLPLPPGEGWGGGASRIVVTESGIVKPEDVALMRSHDVHAFLVGVAFMRAEDCGAEWAKVFSLKVSS